MSVTPRFSIIIPSGREERVAVCIDALLLQSVHAEQEIIVVTPHAQALSGKWPGVEVVEVSDLFPPGRMRNVGAERARGQTLLFIDDDCVPPPDWVDVMGAAIESEEAPAMVGCRVENHHDAFWGRCADYCLFSAFQYRNRADRDLGSAAIAVRRDAFEQSGGFDEQLLGSEDWDFSMRLRTIGERCLFIPEIIVAHHHGRASFSAILKSAYLSGLRSGLVVQRRYYDRMSWLARLSVKAADSGLYGLMVLPYSLLVCALHVMAFVRTDIRVLFYWPTMFLARFQYQRGALQAVRAEKAGA